MHPRSALGLILIFAVLGCGRMGRVKECKKLSSLVNPKLDEIESLAKSGRPQSYKAAAKNYDALARRVRAEASWSPDVKPLANEYSGVLDSVAPAVSAYATALEAHDTQALDDARRTLDRLAKHEHSVVARIDAYCRSP